MKYILLTLVLISCGDKTSIEHRSGLQAFPIAQEQNKCEPLANYSNEKWQVIETEGVRVVRIRVPGGWLVKGRGRGSFMIFFDDPCYEWVVDDGVR